MKQLEKTLNAMAFGLLALLTANCGGSVASDPETEAKLNGTWQWEYSEYEDGVELKSKCIETYSLPDHSCRAECNITMTSPFYMDVATVSWTGTWKASKEQVECKIDKESISFNFNDEFDSSDRREFEDDFLSELKKVDYKEGMRFTSEITDKFTAVDDEDDTTYTFYRL